ncbi:uncharacterized protein LOC116252399 [Nymphaea colorata]|nr:uncharacterized protein LOC116252399 [Nymphaea colorata]
MAQNQAPIGGAPAIHHHHHHHHHVFKPSEKPTAVHNMFSGNDSGGSDSQFFSGLLPGAMASTADSPGVLVVGRSPDSKSPAGQAQSLLIHSPESSAFLAGDQGHFEISSSQVLAEVAHSAPQVQRHVQLQSEYSHTAAPAAGGGVTVPTQGVDSLTPSLEVALVVQSDQKNYPAPIPSDDGYNWRKYGQKQVKGTDYPRSYYKCSHPDCFMKKKVGRSSDGLVTEIVYKGQHNHEPPQQTRRAKESMSSSGKIDGADGKDNDRNTGLHGASAPIGKNDVVAPAKENLGLREDHLGTISHIVRNESFDKRAAHLNSLGNSANVAESASSVWSGGKNGAVEGKGTKVAQVRTLNNAGKDLSAKSTGKNDNLYGKAPAPLQTQSTSYAGGNLYEANSSLSRRDHDGRPPSPRQLSGSSDFDDEVDADVVLDERHGIEPLSIEKNMDILMLDSAPTTPKTPRETRVVVHSTNEKDSMDDGYRWRKYGQKIVKGNPNPRSYYKCTHMGCNVRKHVERASNDSNSVITTYEGKHNHDMPAAKNSGLDTPTTLVANTDKKLKTSKSSTVQQSAARRALSAQGTNEMAHSSPTKVSGSNQGQIIRSTSSKTGMGSKNQNALQQPSLDENLISASIANESSNAKALTYPSQVMREPLPPAVVTNHALSIGQEFADAKSCRRAIKEIAIALRFDFKTVKSNPTCFTAKCSKEGCPWRVHASKLPCGPSFTIRTLKGIHTCGGIANLSHKQASVDWVASVVQQRLRENPRYKPKEIVQDILQEHGISISYKQAYRGKERSMENIYGSYEGGYRLLNVYCKQIRNINPGSVALVLTDEVEHRFQRLFVAIHASIYGFVNACRPLLGIDGARLKGKYFGVIFSATAIDAEGGLFPLAFGVVDVESNENWMWFLSELRNLLEQNMESIPMLTILSNRQKGVVEGVAANFPSAFHGFYLRHLSENLKKKFGNKALVRLFLNAAYSLTITDFEGNMSKIEEISTEASQWVRQIPPHLWATSYIEGAQFGHLTSNMVEQFNSWVLEARDLPIVQLIEHIHQGLINRFQKRLDLAMTWASMFVPSIEKRLSETLSYARRCQVFQANEVEFEVLSTQGTHGVNICDRYCSCRGWQIYGIPCTHAAAALLSCQQDVHQFVNKCFTAENYRKAYSEPIHPIPDKSLWMRPSDGSEKRAGSDSDDMIVHPPLSRRSLGQPPKKKIRMKDHP